ncbi:DUF4150 domain-containing protein [Roseateles sp. UC29_93]|uniref:DUF4150 domain-containing protein n=1 Tax=Roseateles TaxID=93681 RepID=UPI000308048A
MPVTIKVNGTVNSLVHKFSNGISAATIPDVCKTPSPGGPVPIPYPNIAQSMTLSDGTTTVKGDKAMAAIKGSKFAMSNGDNPGTLGGVKSSTFMKEATWILYSFDTKMNGKNCARLMDKMFHNHENAANLGGEIQGIATADFAARLGDKELADELCDAACHVTKNWKPGMGKRQDMMAERLSSSSFKTHGGNFTTYTAKNPRLLLEAPALSPMTPGDPMIMLVSMTGRTIAGTTALTSMAPGVAAFGGIAKEALALGGRLTIWDAVSLKSPAGGIAPGNISKYIEVKFPKDTHTRNQRFTRRNMSRADKDKIVEMKPDKDCACT